MNKRTIAGVGVILFVVTAIASIFDIFFNAIFLTAMKYIFFALLGLLVLLIIYRLFERKRRYKIKKETTLSKFLKHKLDISFQIFLTLFLIGLIINEFKKITFINMNYAMIFVVVLGILSILFPYERSEIKQKSDKVLSYFFALLGAIIIFIKTPGLGWLRYVVAIVLFFLVILLSDMIYEESDE